MPEVNEERNVPLDLLRAELKSALAEQMVVLIDRFTGKRDFEELKRTVEDNKNHTDQRFTELASLIRSNAITEERSRQIADDAIDSRLSRSWITKSSKATLGMLAVGMISLISSPIATYFITTHTHR